MKEQDEIVEKIPMNLKEQVELEQRKENKLELKRAKESLWKLRKTEKKLEQTPEMIEIEKLEKRQETIEKVLQKYKTTLMEQEKEIRKEPRNKTTNKNNKQTTKTTKLGEIWTVYRWITEFLAENNQKWEKDLEQYMQNEKKQLESWDKLTRKEKIEKIQQKPDPSVGNSTEITPENKETEQAGAELSQAQASQSQLQLI